MAKRKKEAASPFAGVWQIAAASEWSAEELNEGGPAQLEFASEGSGSFRFLGLGGDLDYEEGTRDGKPAVEFSWEGFDGDEQAFGRGWAALEEGALLGLIAIHRGGQSRFVAKRSAKAPKKSKPKAKTMILPMPTVKPAKKLKAAKQVKPIEGPSAVGKVYQLKITLKDITPPIWRRVLVPDCDLELLHMIIQEAMGWTDSHLHEFVIGKERYTDEESAMEMDADIDAMHVLSEVVPKEKAKFQYVYDFGDDWRHEILVEKVLPPGQGVAFPICVDGKRACPPEDCGGPWGYGNLLEAIGDPSHERHGELCEWAGEIDPEAFDIEAINESLRHLE